MNTAGDMSTAERALEALIERLSRQLVEAPEQLSEIPPEKAVGHILRAIQTAAQLERMKEAREKGIETVRAQVMTDLRAALERQPALMDQLERLLDEGQP